MSTKSWTEGSAPRANLLPGFLTSTRLTQLHLRDPPVPHLYRGALYIVADKAEPVKQMVVQHPADLVTYFLVYLARSLNNLKF